VLPYLPSADLAYYSGADSVVGCDAFMLLASRDPPTDFRYLCRPQFRKFVGVSFPRPALCIAVLVVVNNSPKE
jgi:hypothetical protein